MNSFICNQLACIDAKSDRIIMNFKTIEHQVSPQIFDLLYKPSLNKLLSCYTLNNGENFSIHDVHDECERILDIFYQMSQEDLEDLNKELDED